MEFEQEVPTAPPPSAQINRPWMADIEYKSGKTQSGFAALATPEMANAGFSYYDTTAKERFKLTKFRAIVVASLAGVFGTNKDGERYVNYWSNLVSDTKTDALEVRISGISQPQFSGNYQADIKPHLPAGVSYTQVLIVYVPELNQFMAMHLTMGLQQRLKAAIGHATNTKADKVSLYGLCALTTEFWGFEFSGEFEKCDKDGVPHTGNGEMYFMPQTKAFIVRKNDKNAASIAVLENGSADCANYLTAEQIRIAGKKPVAPIVAPPSAESNFPTEAPPVNTTTEDDLPF